MAAPNQPNREKQVFEQALDLPTPEQRQAYLKRACGEDAALLDRVQGLLRAHIQAEDFLPGEPVAAGARTAVAAAIGALASAEAPVFAITEKPGDTIGRYKLLEKLGEGGFGVVYMAEQREPVRRKVALKIIKVGMDTREVVARFEAERQALALMDHPNIAKILDGGATGHPLPSDGRGAGGEGTGQSQISNLKSQLPAGRPYFVMELVRGVRITDFCDQNHLGVGERLELFMQVCHAVQHAHQKGIIHRDLKPSNILVTINDGVPVPKIIDFGIAKATQQELTEKTLFTAYGQFLGTPAYMSPEQTVMTSLDVDTRSDIYSLGVLLYELLTGRPPFDTSELLKIGLDELCRTLREVEPPRPSTRLTQDLVAADVRRRTSGANEESASSPRRLHTQRLIPLVRGDLDWIVMKCLEKDRARRYETANGLVADLQRHLNNEPVTARAPSASYRFSKFARRNRPALVVAATIAAVLVLATGVSFRQAQAARKAQRDADAKAKAERAAREESEAITEFLSGVFRSSDPARDGRTITVAETLATASKRLETDLADQPVRRAQLQATLATTYQALGLRREAIALREKVRDFCQTTFGPKHLDTHYAMHRLAQSYQSAGRRDEAIKLEEEVLARFRVALGPRHRDTLSAMADLVDYYEDDPKRHDEAVRLGEETLKLMREVNGPEHRYTLALMNSLAFAYSSVGRWDDALKLEEETLARRRKISGPEHPETLVAMNNLAGSYEHAGRRDEALKLRGESLELMRKVNGPEHPHTLVAMHNLAGSYSKAGRRDEALKLRTQALELMRKVNGPEHPDTLAALNDLALSFKAAGRVTEAVGMVEETLALLRKVNGPEHPRTLKVMRNLANAYLDTGRTDDELRLRQELLAVARQSATNNPVEVESILGNLADVQLRRKEFAAADSLHAEVLDSRRRRPGAEDSSTVAVTTAYRGEVLSEWAWTERHTNAASALTRSRDGERLLQEALSRHQRLTNMPAWRVANVQSQLGGAMFVTAIIDTSLTPSAREARLTEAETLLLQGHAGQVQDKNSYRGDRRNAVKRLARLYEAWNPLAPNASHAATAAEWKQKLADFDRTTANTNTKPAGAEP